MGRRGPGEAGNTGMRGETVVRGGRGRVVAWAGVVSACLLAGASGTAAQAAAASPAAAGPSGIGLAAGGPAVLSSAAYYDRALTSPDWVKTPDGLVYRSCSGQIPQGDELDAVDNVIITASGARKPIPACPYSRLVPPQQAAAAGAAPAPSGPGWLSSSAWHSDDWISSLSAAYAAPAAPSNPPYGGGATYLFAGLSPTNNSAILQPVLGYGPTNGAAGSGDFLWMASYYFWGGNARSGPVIPVGYNDTIKTSMVAKCPNSTGGECTWTITMVDKKSNRKSILVVRSSPAYHWVYGGVLEAYITDCNQLFRNGHGVFRNLIADDGVTGKELTPPVAASVPGSCSATTNVGVGATDITWTAANIELGPVPNPTPAPGG